VLDPVVLQKYDVMDFSNLFFGMDLIAVIVEETNRNTEQFVHGHKLSGGSTAGAWKLVSEGEMFADVVLGLFILSCVIQKPVITTERSILRAGFGDVTQDRLGLICKCLHFPNVETLVVS
jgi:hypothetical protein